MRGFPTFWLQYGLVCTSCSALCCSSFSLKWKGFNDVFPCLLIATCTRWDQLLLLLLLLRTSWSWICRPMTTVCLGGWCQGPSEGGDVWHQMFVCNIFGIVLPQTHWVVGFSSSQWSACLLEDECVSAQWAQDDLDQMLVKAWECQWWGDCEPLVSLFSLFVDIILQNRASVKRKLLSVFKYEQGSLHIL